jgi:uncharacterized protein YndB with AHSA1/START domain
MIKHEVTIHFNRPVEQVFAFLVDTGKVSSWQSSLIELEQLTEGPLRAGSRFREIRRLGRRDAKIEGQVTAFEPNKRLETQTITKPKVTVSYSFDRENGGTRLRYKFVLLSSGIMRLLEPLIASSLKKERESDFETLKHLLES